MISTYNSPEKLRVALRSVALQTHPVDEIIVVGDCCSRETGEMLGDLKLPNLRYINLSVRCGEQAIPNAIGTLASTSKYVAYLNHDDLWLPWHISMALEGVSQRHKSWFVGSAAFCESEVDESSETAPVFELRSDPLRTIVNSFSKTYIYLEPNSSWLIERDKVLAANNWTPAWKIGRTPVAELALKLWRYNGEPAFCNSVSVAKIKGDRSGRQIPLYTRKPSLHLLLERLIINNGQHWPQRVTWPTRVDEHRGRPAIVRFRGLPGGQQLSTAMDTAMLLVYWLTGIDLVGRAIRRRWGAGHQLSRALRRRTGERHLAHYEVADVAAMVDPGESRNH